MPPAGPPAEDLDELRALYVRAVAEHGIAVERLKRCISWAADRHLDAYELMHLPILVSTRTHEAGLWQAKVAELAGHIVAAGGTLPPTP